MNRIEKTIFISYRRNVIAWALAIFQDLHQHGYDVFFDLQGLASGDFEEVILENIRGRAHFLVLLTPTALGRCVEENDLFRREIEEAITYKRNVVPIMLDAFSFGAPEVANQLTGKLAALANYNGLTIYPEYIQAALEKLRTKFLDVAIDAVLQPPSKPARDAATKEQVLAERTPTITQEALRRSIEPRYLFEVKIEYDDGPKWVEGTRATEPYGPGVLEIYDGSPMVARFNRVERWSRQKRL